MTEPVAYLAESRKHGFKTLTYNKLEPNIYDNVPLYTSDQLHPRVKMTHAEFDEFKNLISEYGFVLDALQAIYNGKYKNLNSKLFNGRTVESDNEQVKILTNLMSKFDPDNPEETIEIIPDMKWFVRSKEKENGHYQLLAESRISDMPRYTIFKHYATPFDTKEQAEFWTNPLTEAVQLPVEGE